MKREIRFRGRTKEGKWLYGSLVIGAFIVTDEMLKDVPIDKLGVEIIYGKVDESTVGQYTGLKDKNGKEIYEGDIVRCWEKGVEYERLLPLVYDETWCQFVVEDIYIKQYYNLWMVFDEFEVVGNIHNNPELLEGGE